MQRNVDLDLVPFFNRKMGQIRSRMVRSVKNYNVERRAEKLLEKRSKMDSVPESAPKHPSTVERIDRFRSENPQLMEAVTTKYESLHDRLKTVFVESQGVNPEIKSSREPLKLSKKFHEEEELGSMEVDYEVPSGKISLRTALELLTQHQMDPQTFSASAIATQHGLNVSEVEQILTHFKILQLHIPKEMYAKNKNMKKLVQDQIDHSKSYMTQNLKIPSDEEIKEIKKKMEKQLPAGTSET